VRPANAALINIMVVSDRDHSPNASDANSEEAIGERHLEQADRAIPVIVHISVA